MKKKALLILIILMSVLPLKADDRFPPRKGQIDRMRADAVAEGLFAGTIGEHTPDSVEIKSAAGDSYWLKYLNFVGYTVDVGDIATIRASKPGAVSVIVRWTLVKQVVYLKDISFKSKEDAPEKPEVRGQSSFDEGKKDKDEQSRQLYTSALGYLNNGNPEEAYKICQAIKVLNPKYDKLVKLVSDIEKKLKQKEAKAHLDKAVGLAGQGKIIEASSEWQLALSASPDDEELVASIRKMKQDILDEHNKKAKELFDQEKLISAVAEWNLVLAIEKNDGSAKKGMELANKRLNNLTLREKAKLSYENFLAAAKKEYENKNYLVAIQNYRQAVLLATELQIEKDIAFLNSEIKRVEALVETSRKSYLDNAARFAASKDWLNMCRELRNCLRIDPENAKAADMLKQFKAETEEIKERLYLEGLEAYGREDAAVAIAKWNDVLILDPLYEKATLNVKKAERKLVKKDTEEK